MKVLVATEKPFSKAAVDGIRTIVEEAGYELALLEKYTDVQQFYDAVADADALIVRSDKVTKEVIDHANNLKIVVRAGAGYDNLDLAKCTDTGTMELFVGDYFEKAADKVMSCSIGISIYPETGMDYNDLFEKADESMYYVKKHGKNGYAFAE